MKLSAFVVVSALGLGVSSVAQADALSDFYDGKTIRFYICDSPGGGYDLYMRTLVQYMGKCLPGKPNAIVVNMPGSGGVKASNYVYNVAPRNGTT